MELNKKNRSELKSYFLTNSIPTQKNFEDFIEACLNQKDDGIAKTAGHPIAIQAEGDEAGQQEVLQFYKNFNDNNPSWTFNLNPRTQINDASTKKPGLSISDSTGATRFFIKNDEGNIGIGTISPAQKLHIQVNNSGLNLPLYLRNLNGTQGGNAIGIGFLNEAAGDWPKAAIVHERTTAFGVGSLKFLVNNGLNDSSVSLNDAKMTINGDGYVGIGTTTPGFPLNFTDALGDKISLWGRSGNSYGFGIQPSLLQIHTDGSGSDIAFGYGSSAGFNETLRIKGNGMGIMFPANPGGGGGDLAWIKYYARSGEFTTLEIGVANDPQDHISLMPSGNVGIGTLEPQAKLHVNGAIYAGTSDVYFTNIEHNHTGIGNTPGFAAIENAKNYDCLMILGRAAAGTPALRRVKLWDYLQVNGNFDVSGSIGIGTNAPRAQLDVNGVTNVRYGPYRWLARAGMGEHPHNELLPVSIIATHRIVASEFNAVSDIRIKKDFFVSSAEADLKTLNQLQIIDFRYKESTRNTKRN